MYLVASFVSNSYIMGVRDVWHLLHRSTRAHHARGLRSIKLMPCIRRAHDITILYPVGMDTQLPSEDKGKEMSRDCLPPQVALSNARTEVDPANTN